MATLGTLLILYEIVVEFMDRSVLYALFFSGVAVLSFFILQKARERVHVHGHDWGWVFLHASWHFVSVLGAFIIVHRQDALLSASLQQQQQHQQQ